MENALAQGAELGQGWRFGHPQTLDEPPDVPRRPLRRPDGTGVALNTAFLVTTPFALGADIGTIRSGSAGVIASVETFLLYEAERLGALGVLLASTDKASGLHDLRRYAALAEHLALVGVLSDDLSDDLSYDETQRLRTGVVHPSDSLRGELAVVVLGPHFAAALVARRSTEDASSLYDYAVVFDRPSVIGMAMSLLQRLTPRAADVAVPDTESRHAGTSPRSNTGRLDS